MRTINIPEPIAIGSSELLFQAFVVTLLNYDDRFNYRGYAGFRAAMHIEMALEEAIKASATELSLEEADYALLREAVETPQHQGQPGTWPLNQHRRLLLPFAEAILAAR